MSALAPLSMGLLVLPRACSSMGSPWGHSPLWVHPPGLMCIPPGEYLFHHEPPVAAGRGTPCLTMVCTRGCRESQHRGWSTFCLSFFTPLGVCRVASLMYSHSFSLAAICFCFPLVSSVIPEVLTLSLKGLALASCRSALELLGIGFIRHRESSQRLLIEVTPVVPPCCKNLATQAQYIMGFF